MSEVRRYIAIGGMMPVDEGYGEGVYVRDGDFRVLKSELDTRRKDFDRVTAERDALQQHLTAADERLDQAVTALNEIARISRMGEEPFEIATLAIGEMSALKPVEGGVDE